VSANAPHPDVVPPVVVDAPHLLGVAAEVNIPRARKVAETETVTMIVETVVTVIALVVQMTGMAQPHPLCSTVL
jgi:hypothetical protein